MGKAVDANIIIIDNCTFSRVACENMLYGIYSEAQVLAFECFTDYKLWDLQQMRRGSGEYYIIFNAATCLFYTTEVVEFLKYEQEARKRTFPPAHVLMLTNRSRPLLYANEIMAHYMMKNNAGTSFAVISSFLDLKVNMIRQVLTTFISEGAEAVNRVFYHRRRNDKQFSASDLRAMVMLMTGEKIETFASRYQVSVKTMYTQRSQVLQKLSL